jgi:Xaa-Pro aminopeptidase
MVPLQPGMLISNEPGFYKVGAYGIRIENVVLVTEPEKTSDSERPMMSFETLTLAPIDLRLIIADMLSSEELAWINAYHARVFEMLSPSLDQAASDWLQRATRPMRSAQVSLLSQS